MIPATCVSTVRSVRNSRRTNRGVARRLFLTERTVETHVAGIMTKLGLATGEEDHRRVLAVLAYVKS